MLSLIGADNKLFLWNVGTEETLVEYEMPDLCLSLSFNFDGSKFASTCKDKMMRVYDTREATMLQVNTREATMLQVNTREATMLQVNTREATMFQVN